MNKDKHQNKHDHPHDFGEKEHKSPNLFTSQKSLGNSVMTGLISGQSMPYLKNSENEIKSRFFGSDWDSKSKSESKVNQDFEF